MNILTADCNVTILLLCMSTVPYRLLCNTNSTLLYLFSRDLSKEHLKKCRTAHTTWHHTISHHIISCHTTSHHITLNHITSCYISLEHTTLYQNSSQYHVTSHHTKWHYITLSSREQNPQGNGGGHKVTNQELAPKFAINRLGGRIPVQGFLVGRG